MKATSVLFAAAILASPALAQGGDDCSVPTALTANGSYAFDTTAASTSGFDGGALCAVGASTINQDLFWTFTVPVAGDYQFDTDGSSFDTKLSIHTGGTCAATCLDYDDDGGAGLQSLIQAFGLNAGDVILVQVGGFGTNAGLGTLTIEPFIVPPTPDCLVPDAFEDNDDCANAPTLGDGTYAGLNVEELDQDYFTVGVDAGATLQVDIFFIDDFADVDLYLWDPSISCDTNVAGTDAATAGFLVRGFTATDDEQIIYTNSTGAAQTLIVEVDMWTGGGCNDYDMVIVGSNGMGGGGGIGSVFCTGNPNSTGNNTTLTVLGSTSVAANDVTLSATLSPNSFGYYITSQTNTTGAPVGSGVICLGGNVGRFNQGPQIKNSGAMGTIDLSTTAGEWTLVGVPTSTGPYSAAAGTTTYFQLWHRDTDGMGGLTSNFSDGVGVNWTL